MTRAEEYKAKLDAIVDRAAELPASARAAVLEQLRQAADAVRLDLMQADPTSFSASRLKALKAEIDRVMAQFAQSASADVAKVQRTMYADSSKNVTAVVSVAAKSVAVQPIIDTHTLSVAQDYSADLITGLSDATAQRINSAIQRAALGGSTHQHLIAQIGGALEGGEFSGIFSEAGARAATIADNEVLRVHSLASMARMQDLAKRHEGIEKEWLHIPIARRPRTSHIFASGQTRSVDEPFSVGGEDLMYPRDPSGSAENTINCHCLVRPKLSEALLKPSDSERNLLDRLGIAVTTTRS